MICPFCEPKQRVLVAHMYYHVLPRDFKDRMHQLVDIHDPTLFEDLSPEEHDRIAKLLE
ncbi:MAG: hypothetical protein KGH79_00835 [Patescibacteria group bacterium]|nr:hypothetical protein [Patescibacteria group bacterium]